MTQIRVRDSKLDLEEPVFVEGFPGLGLVGKIATDHLIRELELEYYASVDCDGLPRIGTYRGGDRTARPPVRIYASEAHNLLALQSDVPISSEAVTTVADCLAEWILSQEATPVYLSGLPAEREETPELYGVGTGDARELLEANDIDVPPEDGVVTGPTGALLNRAAHGDADSIGLVVESSPQFPDPEAASVLLESGIAPIADLEIDVSDLLERATEIKEKREQFAQQMQQIGQDESSQAQPLRMYQ